MKISRRIRITALVIAGLLVAIIVGLWLGVPAAARWGIETAGSRELGRALHVGKIRFNPFTLRATLDKFSVGGLPDESAPLLTVDRTELNLSIASLRHLAPVIEELHVQGVRAHVVRLAENSFNFSDIVDRMLAKPASPEPARYALYNVEVDDAAIAFDDRVLKAKHSLDDIKLGIPFLSSLPDDVEIKVRPSFSAKLDGDPIALTAEAQPFEPARDTSAALKLVGMELPRYLGYVPVRPNFDLKGGTLDADLHVHFRRATAATDTTPAQAGQLSVSGALAIRDFAFAARGASPLLTWKRLDVAVDELAPLDGRAKLKSVTLAGAHAILVRRADGSIAGIDALTRPIATPTETKPDATATGRPFAFEVGQVKVNDGAVDFQDEGAKFTRRIAPITAQLQGLSNRAGTSAQLTSTLVADDATQLTVQGDVGIAPLKLALKGELAGLPLKNLQPYLREFTTARVDGSLSAGANVLVEQGERQMAIRIEQARVDAKGLRVRGGKRDSAALDLSQLSISGGAVDLTQHTASVEQIKADGLRATTTRAKDGELDWANLAVAQKSKPAPAAATAPAPWKLRVGEVQVNGARVQMTDQTVEPAARLAADRISFTAKDLSSDLRQRMSLALQARTGGGTVSTRGWLRVTPLASNLALDVRNVDVGALRPYLKQFANAELTSASLWARGKLALDTPKGAPAGSAPRITYDGTGRVTNLALLEGNAETELLRWQALDLGTVAVRAGEGAPDIQLGAVKLTDFYARVILSEAGRLNLVDVFKPAAAQEQEPSPPTQAAPVPAAEAPSTKPHIQIGSIEIERGNVNFTDHFVKPNYTANLTDLKGTVSTLAPDAPSPADVSIRGRLDGDAPVEITGKANPLAPKVYLDIAGSAKGVELPRLTPYSVKYAGYPITKGKLSMDVRYHLENQQLKAENHLFLDQLTFGEHVDSPTATKLPVLFAVSLLKNHRGEIDINLPISGSLDDPKFSIGGIIVRVIVNLLVKAVTAPFSLLAAAFGGGEELSYIGFPPASAILTPADDKKLETLAKALNDRPALRLEITGRADPAVDTEPLRMAKFDAKLRAAKVRQIVRGGESVDPAKVTFTDAERPALIAQVYDQEKIPNKPRNFLGIAKTIPTPEMEKLILATITVDEADLRKLANDRAAAVRDQLETQGKVPRERMFLVAPKLDAEGIKDKGATTRVDLSLK